MAQSVFRKLAQIECWMISRFGQFEFRCAFYSFIRPTTRSLISAMTLGRLTLKEYNESYGNLDPPGLVDSLKEQTSCEQQRPPEGGQRPMLTAQAHISGPASGCAARQIWQRYRVL